MLNMITHGERTDQPGLLIAHGLYGSARNWGVIAKRLSDERQVVAVDMRNHGQSDWANSHTYQDLADDLGEVLDHLPGPWHVMGHSMGGKAAMVLALSQPDLIDRLIVADIAPVPYEHSQIQYVDAMKGVDLGKVEKRSDAVDLLTPLVDDPQLVPFFLQSLDVKNRRWILNLDVLAQEMAHVVGFPDISGAYERKALFLTGALSDYVQQKHRPEISRLFPKARFVKIPEAEHWLHAQKPREFEAAVRAWLQ